MPLVKLSSKGQIVIPQEIRQKLGLKPRKYAIVELIDNRRAEIRPVPDVREELRGVLKKKPSMSKALVSEHLEEIQRDEALSS
ncbi:AbrB/MazE/SpoVT family DNA-binding domain-containing protein [Acidobacteria bacterium AH-259-L09]|nr:AbrB/MazE/SpoVT family DNA-binding domain-containing protein [Acidobacteria bacterium AH-259-L09]